MSIDRNSVNNFSKTSEMAKFEEKNRTISLMSHITKLILRGVKRVRGRTLQKYGFMSDKVTRNSLFVLRRMSVRAIEKHKDIYACFINYSKSFHTVRHEPLIDPPQAVDS